MNVEIYIDTRQFQSVDIIPLANLSRMIHIWHLGDGKHTINIELASDLYIAEVIENIDLVFNIHCLKDLYLTDDKVTLDLIGDKK